MKPCLHFVGFRDPTRYANAVRVWGLPDFVHDEWDARAYEDFMPTIDTMVIADIALAPRLADPRPAAPPADPSPEALEAARRMMERATKKRPGWSSPWIDMDKLALALDAFRREGIEQERARLKNAIVPYDGAGVTTIVFNSNPRCDK